MTTTRTMLGRLARITALATVHGDGAEMYPRRRPAPARSEGVAIPTASAEHLRGWFSAEQEPVQMR